MPCTHVNLYFPLIVMPSMKNMAILLPFALAICYLSQARLEAAARELVECKAATKEAKADAKTAAEIAAELRGELAAVKGDQIITPTTKKGRTP